MLIWTNVCPGHQMDRHTGDNMEVGGDGGHDGQLKIRNDSEQEIHS